ncbi:MAG: hypothetical protein JSV24_06600, partial [Bacteroidales bacterium]
DQHTDAGGLGVKMIDGKGKFLPESKRALPTPLVAFFKIFGISSIFPGSGIFGKYHLGYLSPDETHEIEVLPGAFMFLRKKALDTVGLLDEDFFMYGEDIDLSCRLIEGGYKNYYLPDTTIIHYKGESTKKGSLNYVIQFYKAMIIYAGKHFSKRNLKIFQMLINLAIYFRATISLTKRIFYKLFLPVMDAVIIYAGISLITPYWERYKFPGGGHYPDEFMQMVVPVYILIWILSVLFSGGYEKRISLTDTFKGIVTGTILILVIYALIPVTIRFSRAMILFGAAWAAASVILLRILLDKLNLEHYKLKGKKGKRLLIIGNQEESRRVRSILEETSLKPEIVGVVSPVQNANNNSGTGHPGQIEDIVRINRVDEIIFCSRDIPAEEIIRNMVDLTAAEVDFKIAPPESISIIGSNSIETAGDLYLIPLNSISKPVNKRKKRLLDLVLSLIFLLLLPVMLFFVAKKRGLMQNILSVLLGKKTWIGYFHSEKSDDQDLPVLRNGILSPVVGKENLNLSNETIRDLNLIYAKDYKINHDIQIIFKGFRHLGA